jgi:hypothetical protein
MVYSAHSVTWAALEPTAQKETSKRYGNVESLLEAFRPNGLDRCISGLPKAARDANRIVNWSRPQGRHEQSKSIFEAPGRKSTPGVLL